MKLFCFREFSQLIKQEFAHNPMYNYFGFSSDHREKFVQLLKRYIVQE